MFRTEYKREMDALEPSREALARLEGLTRGETGGKPVKHFSRRAAVALALCAALAVTAVAAGPSVWSALREHLGPFKPYGQKLEGVQTFNGIEVKLLEAVTDGYSARVYYTLTDLEGDRLSENTVVSGGVNGVSLGAVSRIGGQVISYDPDTRTLLMEKTLMGADFNQPAVLTVQTADSAWREFDTVLPVTIPDTPIQTTQEDGRGTALPGQNTVADPNCGDYVLSTVGFDAQGRFHALVLFGEEFTNLTAVAVPYVPGAEGMDRYPGESDFIDVKHGEDNITTGVTPEQVSYVELSGSYRGEEEPVELNVIFPLDLQPVEQWSLEPRRAVGGVEVEKIHLSPLSLAVFYRDSATGFAGQVALERKDGTQVPLRLQIGSAMTTEDQDLRYDFWSFDEPVELDDTAPVPTAGEPSPLDLP